MSSVYMIYIFGDSHANYNFRDLPLPNINLHENSITMHRIGRDGILKFNPTYCRPDSIFIFAYGEIDCRCHVGKQLRLGRVFEDICKELVDAYIHTINTAIFTFKKVIICSIVPPISSQYWNEPSDFPFPMIGDDAERVKTTERINTLIKEACASHGYVFLDIYDYYAEEDKTLRYDLSDKIVHIANNIYIHNALQTILDE